MTEAQPVRLERTVAPARVALPVRVAPVATPVREALAEQEPTAERATVERAVLGMEERAVLVGPVQQAAPAGAPAEPPARAGALAPAPTMFASPATPCPTAVQRA